MLIWVDRNQLGRRNLTDSQRTEVIGRIYNTKKMAQGRPRKEEKPVKVTGFSSKDPTAEEVAEETGVSVSTVYRAGKFAEAVAALERISPKAAEIVRRDEVRDAKTQLPKVPPEVLPFVAEKIEEGKRVIKEILREWRQRIFSGDAQQGQAACPSSPCQTIPTVRAVAPCPTVTVNGFLRRSTTTVGTCLRRRGRNRPVCQRVRINDDLNFLICARCSNRALKTNKSLGSTSIPQSLACNFRAFSVPSAIAFRTVSRLQPN